MSDFVKNLFAPLTAFLDFIQKYFKALLFLLIIFLIFFSANEKVLKEPNLMKIDLTGPIENCDEFLRKLKEAKKNSIKGVLFVVNSPGGAVAPSVEISLAIKKLKEKKPVVAYAAGTMASGSYYASIWADKIVANPGAVIGSIGVLFEGMNIEDLMKKIGVEPQVIAKGKYKQIGTIFRKWKPYEKEELERLIEDTYNMFVEDVAKARNLDVNKSYEFADAHVFTAKRAKEVGLIDKIGSIEDAKKELERESGVKNPVWKEPNKFDKFMENLAEESSKLLFKYFVGLKAY